MGGPDFCEVKMETWKEIPGYDRYEVSDLGRVRSWRVPGHSDLRAESSKIKTQRLSGIPGHERWCVRLVDRTHPVHRLVLLAFAGEPPAGYVACHRDGNRDNNQLDNLRWDTQKSNLADRNAHGTAPRGEKNPAAKLTVNEVAEIRAAEHHRGLAKELAQRYGVSHWHIRKIRRGEAW